MLVLGRIYGTWVKDTGTSDAWSRYAVELGIRLQQCREVVGLSQEKVAHAAGISTFTYRKLEHGLSNPGSPANPRLRTLVALSSVLKVAVTELLPPDPPDISEGRTQA